MAGRRRNKRKRRSKGSNPDGGAMKDSSPACSPGQSPKGKRKKRRSRKELTTHSSTDNIENRMCATTMITTGEEVHDALNGVLTGKRTCHATIMSKNTSKGKEDCQSTKTKNRHLGNHTTSHDTKCNSEVVERRPLHKKSGQSSRSDNQTTKSLKDENFSKTDDHKDNLIRNEDNEVSVACEKTPSALPLQYQYKKKRHKKSNRKTEDSSNNIPVVLSTSDETFPGKDDMHNAKVNSMTPEIDLDLDVPKPVVKVNCRRRRRRKNKMLVTNCASTALLASIQSDNAEKGLCLGNSDVSSVIKIHDKGVHNCLALSAQGINNTSEIALSKSNKSGVPIEINLLPVDDSSNLIKGQNKKLQSLTPDIQRIVSYCPQKKLLVLDLNGLLADINPDYRIAKADKKVGGKAVFKRPFCEEFLKFCFEKFNVGVWSSRKRCNVDAVVDYLMGNLRHKLLFCWDQSKCTHTGHRTLENRHKPLVLKELKKLWNKEEEGLPWKKGEYRQSNTLLVDDSPYKAICNPPHTAIFPFPYHISKENDDSLGPQGDLRCYLEGLAMADDVQLYVRDHPFGQKAISDTGPSWKFYLQIIDEIEKREQVLCSS